MARPLRIEFPGALYHITSRGNAKNDIFLDDSDRISFLRLCGELTQRYKFIFYAYCLMGNHYHLLVETPKGNLVDGMRRLNGIYTQIFNKRHERVGHLFQGRYKSFLIEKENYLLEVSRYIVLNPMRAGLAKKVGDWPWSSFRTTAGIDKYKTFLDNESLLSFFSSSGLLAHKEYIRFVESGLNSPDPFKDAVGGLILGSDNYAKRVIKKIKSPNYNEIVRRERNIDRPELKSILVGKDLKKEVNEAIIKWNYKLKEVGDSLGLHYSTISKMVSRNSKIKN